MTLTYYYYEEEETTKLIATATEKKNRKGKEEEILSKIIKNDSNTSLSSVLLNNKEQQQCHVNKATTTTENPFESVSHAIQENVIPFFQQQKQQQIHKYEHVSVEEENENEIIDETNTISEVNKESLSLQEEEEQQQLDVLESPLITKENNNNNNRIIAAIVGGIIGGTAGFFLAGPVGLLVGAEYGGQTAGIVSLLLKSSVSFGVVVASVSAGSVTGERVIQQQHNIYQRRRIIRIGNNTKTLMLVRPNIDIDPVWDDLCAKAIREAPSSSKGKKKKSRRQKKHQNNDLDILATNECELSTKDKVFLLVSRSLNDKYSLPGYVYRCLIQDYYDRCINEEINEEKNNIVVKEKKAQSSSLSHKHQSNNKLASVLEEALLLTQEDNNTSLETLSSLPSSSLPSPPSFSSSTTLLAQQNQEEEQQQQQQQQQHENTTTRPRRRVHDVHGIIKHVTATLLQVRPELTSSSSSSSSASCSTITELTATAVEGLVFGKVYDSVMEEIINETRDIDVCLTRKILQYETQRIISYDEKEAEASSTTTISTSIDQSCIFPNISELALKALNMLPSTHSPVDKLQYCVQFLEILSNHFSQNLQKQQQEEGTSSSSTTTTTSSIMNTDSLLTMVCEHIIVAKVPRLNAEITFLEEFARDEQLLRGKEGYALVTMQAGVTFLNTSTDLYNDIIFNSASNNNNGVRHDQ